MFQIESLALTEKLLIVGYYAACENYNDNSMDKCPGQKIAEKIADSFPYAFFTVVNLFVFLLKLISLYGLIKLTVVEAVLKYTVGIL